MEAPDFACHLGKALKILVELSGIEPLTYMKNQ
jgi:hypothetical protein